jgi:uncharacterized protein YndB with AHSA1/START domain
MQPTFTKTISIDAPASKVWAALTNPGLINQWMSESPLEIITNWTIGSPIYIRGKHYKMPFENKGVILQFKENEILEYSHLSSISRLKDEEQNYYILKFELSSTGGHSNLIFSASNSPDEVIYKHLAFYWNVTLEKIKQQVERYNR